MAFLLPAAGATAAGTAAAGAAAGGTLFGAGTVLSAPVVGVSSVSALTSAGMMPAAGGFLGLSSGMWQGMSALGQGLSAMQAGRAQKQQYAIQAEQAEQAAKDRELSRLKTLRHTLATQRVTFASRGISPFEGSPASIGMESMLNYQLERGADLYNTRTELARLNLAGGSSMAQGLIGAAGAGLDYGVSQTRRGGLV